MRVSQPAEVVRKPRTIEQKQPANTLDPKTTVAPSDAFSNGAESLNCQLRPAVDDIAIDTDAA
ncbi:MAG: hypothetical protein ABSF91_15930 [Bacteroidota bacterium]